MPQIAGAVAVAAWNVGFSGATAVALGGAAVAAVQLAAVASLSYATSKAQAKAIHEDARFQSREWLVKGAKEAQTVVYGRAIVGGAVMYANQRHTPRTKDNFEVYLAVAHVARQSQEIVGFYFDDTYISGADIDWSGGKIVDGKYGVSKQGNYAVEFETRLGTSTQTASNLLMTAFPTDWTVNHRARGNTCTFWKFLQFSQSATAPEDIFYSGVPDNVRIDVKGALVYDARLDSTNGGSGSCRFADPSTWAWSENPVMIWNDYRTQYKGIAFDKIDWDWERAQADLCDVLVPIPGGTEKRFTCNGEISLGMTHETIRAQILSSCMGNDIKVNGKWRTQVGAYSSATATITEDDIIGDVAVTTARSRPDRYNSVKGTFFDPVAQGQEVDADAMASSTYAAADGEVIEKVIPLPFSNSRTQVQRIAYKHLLQSRQYLTVEQPLNWSGLRLYPGVRAQQTFAPYGWSRKVVRCTGWKGDPDGRAPVVVTMVDDAAAYWLDPSAGAYSTRDAAGVVTPGVIEIPSPNAGAGAGELTVRNPGFEFGFPAWVTAGTSTVGWEIIRETSSAHSGDWCARHSGAGVNDYLRSTEYVPVQPGQLVKFGGFLKTDAAFVGTAQFYVEWYDSAQAVISQSYTNSSANVAGVSYTQHSQVVQAPANAAFANFVCYVINKTAGSVYCDDVFMDVRTGGQFGDDIIDGDGNVVDDDDVLNGNIVVADSPVQIGVWFTADGTNYTPTTNPIDLTAIWKKLDGTEVARRTLRGTRSGLTVTVTDLSSAGQPTVLSAIPSPGESVVVTATYTSPLGPVVVTFQFSVSSSYGGGGGPSK